MANHKIRLPLVYLTAAFAMLTAFGWCRFADEALDYAAIEPAVIVASAVLWTSAAFWLQTRQRDRIMGYSVLLGLASPFLGCAMVAGPLGLLAIMEKPLWFFPCGLVVGVVAGLLARRAHRDPGPDSDPDQKPNCTTLASDSDKPPGTFSSVACWIKNA